MQFYEKVNFDSPYYIQLKEVIRTKIEDGEYLPGTSIPSEGELAKIYGLNKQTVRNAIELLVKEGLLKKVQGKGTFVEGEKIEKKIVGKQGFISGTKKRNDNLKTKIIKKYLRKAGDYYSQIFNISKEDEIFFIQKLVSRGATPISIEENYIPKRILSVIESVNLSVYSIQEIFDFYGISVQGTEQEINIVKVDTKHAKLLNIEAEDYILKFSGRYMSDGKVIQYFDHYSRGDILTYQVEFSEQKR